jgi:Leucine-rich repeat (LRR) protein
VNLLSKLLLFAIVLFCSNANAGTDGADLPAIQQKRLILSPKTATASYTAFPEAYCNVRNVETIEIYSNLLTGLPPCISRFGRTLRDLTVSDNALLVALPTEIGSFSFLQRLSVTGSAITTIPPQIGNAKHLVNLVLSKNKLNAIPREIGDLTTLEVLDLSNNSLSSAALPDEMGQLTSLRILNLSNNQLTKAPKFLPYLVNLTRIEFAGNPGLSESEKEVILAIFKDRPSKESPTVVGF